MAHKFKIGDKARIIYVHPTRPQFLIGRIVTIMSDLTTVAYSTKLCHITDVELGWDILCLPPEAIEPIVKDNSEKGEWTEELKQYCNYDKIFKKDSVPA